MVRYAKDYELSDVIVVYRQHPWHAWSELVGWLKTNGPDVDWLTPGEVARMLADFSVLDAENVPFVSDPGTAYEVAQAHRQEEAVTRALHWIEGVQALTGSDLDQSA